MASPLYLGGLSTLLSKWSFDFPSISKAVPENYLKKAQYATASRLVSCMINEGSVDAVVVFKNLLSVDNPPSFKIEDYVKTLNSTQSSVDHPLNDLFLIVFPKTKSPISSQKNSYIYESDNSSDSIFNSVEKLDQAVPSIHDSHFEKTLPLFVFQLVKVPILKGLHSKGIYSVGLIDPQEIGSNFLYSQDFKNISSLQSKDVTLVDPIFFMKTTGNWLGADSNLIENMCGELQSSIIHQAYRYENPPTLPDFDSYKSIDWENSIVEGHATHPMHRSRHSIFPVPELAPETDFRHIKIKFIAIEKNNVVIEGDYESSLQPLFKSATETASQAIQAPTDIHDMLSLVNQNTHVIVPVHEMHLPAVIQKFGNQISVLPFFTIAEGQASLRTVSPKSLEKSGLCIKLPLGIKTSSALRTITPWSTHIGPRISKILPILNKRLVEIYSSTSTPYNPENMYVAREIASIVHNDADFDISKYLSCIVREEADYLIRNNYDEKAIVCAALTESLSDGVPFVEKSLGLVADDQKIKFFTSFVDIYFGSLIPYIVQFGWTFEPHQQNTLIRVSKKEPHVVKGIIIRDFGGIKIHLQTLEKGLGTGDTVEMLPDAFADADDIQQVYKIAYHTMIQCQIHRLARALNLHYSGVAWSITRKLLLKYVGDVNHPLYKCWTSPTIDLKSFVAMKLDGLYRDYLYSKVSNVLMYGA
ncbi:hypothetical protein AYI68_g6640 [Smittium mucronatum]|uniref:Aerobactin siderophore biosynthesis IucA/IucC N-terminal domain-containing protein n=1 Tax=Smittium mucronatum TaxID=133383 RepID=A0A1R0GQ58_9FUNG|nr:hypothetical protein AYI68_g6952 [Smittium mucronatum]OLY79293.1 hypothetical protein AYI68_g6640 [Smittium mucronatum]